MFSLMTPLTCCGVACFFARKTVAVLIPSRDKRYKMCKKSRQPYSVARRTKSTTQCNCQNKFSHNILSSQSKFQTPKNSALKIILVSTCLYELPSFSFLSFYNYIIHSFIFSSFCQHGQYLQFSLSYDFLCPCVSHQRRLANLSLCIDCHQRLSLSFEVAT
jgi:hypothetical protein